jgi:hypothetical protein
VPEVMDFFLDKFFEGEQNVKNSQHLSAGIQPYWPERISGVKVRAFHKKKENLNAYIYISEIWLLL